MITKIKSAIKRRLRDYIFDLYGITEDLRYPALLNPFSIMVSGGATPTTQLNFIKEYDKHRKPDVLKSSERGMKHLNALRRWYPEIDYIAKSRKVKIYVGPSIHIIRVLLYLTDQEDKVQPVMYYQVLGLTLRKRVLPKKCQYMWKRVMGNAEYAILMPDGLPYLKFREITLHEFGHLIDEFKKITDLDNYQMDKQYSANKMLFKKRLSKKEASLGRMVGENIKVLVAKRGPSEEFAIDFSKRPTTLLRKHYPALLKHRRHHN